MPMPARPQFSLRWLLGAVTACCIVVGGLATDWGERVGFWLTMLISVGVSSALLACLVRLASGVKVPSRRQLVTSGLAGAFFLFLMWELETVWWQPMLLPWYWVRDISRVWSILSLSLWVTDVSVWRVLRREPDDALLVEASHAARLSLAILGGAAVVSALLSATTFAIRGERRPEPEAGAQVIVVCAGIVAALPWIRILRRRAVVNRQFGIAEYVSLNALVVGSLLPMFAMVFASVVWISDPPAAKKWIVGDLIWFAGHFLPIWVGSALAIAAVLIQLWRDQWHPRSTAVAFTWLSGYWITVIFIDATFH